MNKLSQLLKPMTAAQIDVKALEMAKLQLSKALADADYLKGIIYGCEATIKRLEAQNGSV